MDAHWWVELRPGETAGPLTQEGVRDLIQSGVARPKMRYSPDGREWQLGSDLPQFFPGEATATEGSDPDRSDRLAGYRLRWQGADEAAQTSAPRRDPPPSIVAAAAIVALHFAFVAVQTFYVAPFLLLGAIVGGGMALLAFLYLVPHASLRMLKGSRRARTVALVASALFALFWMAALRNGFELLSATGLVLNLLAIVLLFLPSARRWCVDPYFWEPE